MRADRGKLSTLGPPNGVLVGMIVPICEFNEKNIKKMVLKSAHRKVLWKALNAAPFARILTVKPLWIELITQTQRLILFVQTRPICLDRCREVKPFRPGRFLLQLKGSMRAKINISTLAQI